MKNNSAISLGSRLLLSATLAALLSAGTAPAYAQTANVPPVAAASAVQTANKLSVTFDGSASSDSDGSIASYAWNFGNGKTGTGAKPVHTYAAAGKYAVVLTVKDNAGASASTTLQVDVNAAPVARGTAVQTKNSNMVSFDAGKSTDAEGPIASYSWEFDDGGTATGATATRTYSRPGTYSTKLTVTDSVGASNTTTIKTVVNAKPVPIYQWKQFDGELIIVFAGGDSTDDDGHVTSWSWNFGGGKTASGMDVSHMYSAPGTYPVEFTVKDNSGNSASTTFNVTVVGRPNMAPEAYASATQAPNSLEVAFSSAGSRDPDGSIANYFWTFGNGKTGTGAQIRHTYEEAGAKEASLTVTDNQGTSTTTKFTVNVAALNRAPTARASAAVVAGTLKVDFVSNSTDPEGDSTIASHQWIFGDGGTASGATTSHVYGAAGPYNASLTVTDNKGASSKVDFTVNIAALPNRAPVAVASSTQTPGTLDVVFSGAGSTDEDKNIASYEWTFSDGGSASGITATHKYAAAGTYTAHLIVTDEKGAQHGVDLTVNVAAANNKLPTARIASMPVAGSLGVKFNGGGSTDEDGFIKSYAWTFGDGGTSTEASPTHTYASARTYPVSLTVTDDGGAVHTQTLNLDVKATTPTASKWVTGYYAGWYWHDYKPQVIDM
ncbi:MAG TPA: PKD domain-containing protein, partial [Burkholderiaceae bacterium]